MQAILAYQWDEVLIPYWRDLVAYANGLGIRKLCLELHGHQNVYNVETFFRRIGRERRPGEASPAPFDPPPAADDIQRETGFGDLQK